MLNYYKRRFAKMIEIIKSNIIKEYAHLEKYSKSFTRKRKMPLEDIILCALSKKGLTTTMEVHKYFIDKGEFSMNISKQGYLQQRKKLNYKVFSFLNKEYLRDFYSSDEPILWNNYIVFAIDGSKTEVPNSDENRAVFGESGNEKSEDVVRALISCMHDVFNHFILDLQIDSIKASEIELAKQNIIESKDIIQNTPSVIIFDRNYPSVEFANFLEKNNIKYLFRLSSNDYKKERELMTSLDESVKLIHTNSRLAKIRKNHPEIVEEMKLKGHTDTRIIVTNSPSENEMALMTNLSYEISSEEIKNLYFKRWKLEEKYHTLKNKMKFESVTGKSTIYVYQDFWAQIIVYNMIQDVMNASNEELSKKVEDKGYKYPMQVNENLAIGLFKEKLIKILIEPNDNIRENLLIQLQTSIEEYVVPLRKLKKRKRKHNLSNKYKNNQKSSF